MGYDRPVRTVVAALIILVDLAFAAPARAKPSATFSYARPAGDASCPDETALRGMITSQLGYNPFTATSNLGVEASIERSGGRLRGRVVLRRDGKPDGERLLEAANDCSNVANALALTVAVAIDTLDPERSAAPPAAPSVPAPAEKDPAPPSPEVAVAPRGAEPAAASPVPAATSPAVRFSLAPRVSGGVAPAASFGAVVSLGERWPSVSVGIEARGDLPAFVPLSIGGELGTSVVLGGAAPCVHLRRFVACAVFAVGSLRGESRGVQNPGSDYGLFGAAGARLGLELPLSKAIALRPEVEGLAAWARPDLRFDGRSVWTAPPVSGSFGLAVVRPRAQVPPLWSAWRRCSSASTSSQ